MKITKSDFKKAISEQPLLTSEGMNSIRRIMKRKKLSLNDAKKELEHERELLVLEFDEFKTCCIWLSKFKKIKTPQFSSYYLKRIVRKLAGEYISNGVLIAAAIHLNIPIKFGDDSPNANIAISKKCPYLKEVGHIS